VRSKGRVCKAWVHGLVLAGEAEGIGALENGELRKENGLGRGAALAMDTGLQSCGPRQAVVKDARSRVSSSELHSS
jgi:hypothetical protein